MANTKTMSSGLAERELASLLAQLSEERTRVEGLLARVEEVLRSATASKKHPSDPAGRTVAAPPATPLDKVKDVMTVTADLREGNGKLSAVRVAKLYQVSLSQLAGWLGRTKQSVSKTPDADSLQNALGYFEHVARLRLITKNDAEFRKWLRTPHELLENTSPLERLAKGEWQVMADYVDDALTGAPT